MASEAQKAAKEKYRYGRGILFKRLLDAKYNWARRGKVPQFNNKDAMSKLSKQRHGCYFCGHPPTHVDMVDKTTHFIFEHDLIATCRVCHKAYTPFDTASSLLNYAVMVAQSVQGLR